MRTLVFNINVVNSTDYLYSFEEQWSGITGVREAGLMMDLRQIVQATGGSTVDVIPVIQVAEVRTDRPHGTLVLAAGTGEDTVDLYRYLVDLSSHSDKAYFRRGLAYKLASGSRAHIHVLLHGAYRQMAKVWPAEEIAVNPYNDNALVSLYPLCGNKPIPTVGVAAAKFIVFGMGNDTGSTLVYQFYARVYNDVLARGTYTAIGSTSTPNTANFPLNTGDIDLSGLSPEDFQWMDLALGVHKSGGTASRCIFHVIPAITYT